MKSKRSKPRHKKARSRNPAAKPPVSQAAPKPVLKAVRPAAAAAVDTGSLFPTSQHVLIWDEDMSEKDFVERVVECIVPALAQQGSDDCHACNLLVQRKGCGVHNPQLFVDIAAAIQQQGFHAEALRQYSCVQVDMKDGFQ